VTCCLLGGLETESEYPYKGLDEKCSFERQEARVYINGSVNISKNEDGGLLLFVVGLYVYIILCAINASNFCTGLLSRHKHCVKIVNTL